MEYTRDIHGVFTGYTYVSGMCRVCIGYVSGKRRKIQGAKRVPGTRKEGKYLPRMARTNTETRNNYLLRAEREKSKLSKLKFE